MNQNLDSTSNLQQIILGGGCFWCIEAAMQRIKGVQEVCSGYAGGHLENPDYHRVCSGETGHAEVVRVVFDASQLPLEELLACFFAVHDPTTLNRQGNDRGPQYRSFIGCNPEQKPLVDAWISAAQAEISRPIVTEVQLDPVFYPAEEEHQNYYNRYNFVPYCQLVIEPKLAKLKAIMKH